MKTEDIIVQNGTFTADITTEALLVLPIRNVRKLFRLMAVDCRNDADSERLAGWFPEAEADAEEAWRAASATFRREYTAVPEALARCQARPVVETRKRNRVLIAAVKKAKARYERIIKIHTIFKGEYTYES